MPHSYGTRHVQKFAQTQIDKLMYNLFYWVKKFINIFSCSSVYYKEININAALADIAIQINACMYMYSGMFTCVHRGR